MIRMAANSAKKLIVVVGATGAQGGGVVRSFLKLDDWRVRGITRDTSKASSKLLSAQGVEMVAADLDSIASLERAFAGAYAIFAVTDFWQFPFHPAIASQAEKEGRYPSQVAYDREVQQALNMFNAASTPAVFDSLKHFIFSSLSSTSKWSGGKYKWNLHFESKAYAAEWLIESLPKLAAKTSFLQVGWYLDNFLNFPFLTPKRQADGSVLFTFLGKASTQNTKTKQSGTTIPYVYPLVDTGPCVYALIEKAPPGTTLLATCQELNHDEFVETFSRVKAVKATWKYISIDEVAELGLFGMKSMPEWLKLELSATFEASEEIGYDGGDPAVKRPQDVGVDMHEMTTVERYIRKTDLGL